MEVDPLLPRLAVPEESDFVPGLLYAANAPAYLLLSLRELTKKANSSTVAYAAAYLDYFRKRAPELKTMRDCEVDKFIVQFLDAGVLRPEAGTDDDLKLKPYKSPRDVGIFASN
ncbi:hypothetical protein J4E86_006048 [Alternaria arbusti]|uniref:uncharacterized protein n=1 Tax=Alternaria arbusti TaxID=232088 RepID=UPI00221F6B46|nr:uncharacterized protein J4E86_006048 [Alternaria arbusti]KAI4954738.1 hypothetical protein J4E86_006048 [Alternaria arbusti]